MMTYFAMLTVGFLAGCFLVAWLAARVIRRIRGEAVAALEQSREDNRRLLEQKQSLERQLHKKHENTPIEDLKEENARLRHILEIMGKGGGTTIN